jgi:hypothetical protein
LLGHVSMSRCLPSLRGWAALVLAVVGSVSYPMMLAPYYVESGGDRWIAAEVSTGTWVVGGLLVLLCFTACVEVFRRGSRPDRVAAFIGLLFSIGVLTEYLLPLTVPVRPNQSRQATPDRRRVEMRRPWSGVPTLYR